MAGGLKQCGDGGLAQCAGGGIRRCCATVSCANCPSSSMPEIIRVVLSGASPRACVLPRLYELIDDINGQWDASFTTPPPAMFPYGNVCYWASSTRFVAVRACGGGFLNAEVRLVVLPNTTAHNPDRFSAVIAGFVGSVSVLIWAGTMPMDSLPQFCAAAGEGEFVIGDIPASLAAGGQAITEGVC